MVSLTKWLIVYGSVVRGALRFEDIFPRHCLLFLLPPSACSQPGLPPRVDVWPTKMQQQPGPTGKEGGGSLARRKAMPPGGHRGALWLCSGLPKPSAGAGRKRHPSLAGCKGKGRFYKFLNFMTMLHRWNVHSICGDVGTENMHWAY